MSLIENKADDELRASDMQVLLGKGRRIVFATLLFNSLRNCILLEPRGQDGLLTLNWKASL